MRDTLASADATGVPDIMLEEHTATSAAVERANAEMARLLDARADRCPTCNGYRVVDDPRCHDHPPMDPPCVVDCPACAA